MTNTNKTVLQLLATLTDGQAVMISNWAKDWTTELLAMDRPAYDKALRGVIAVVKSGRPIQRRRAA